MKINKSFIQHHSKREKIQQQKIQYMYCTSQTDNKKLFIYDNVNSCYTKQKVRPNYKKCER